MKKTLFATILLLTLGTASAVVPLSSPQIGTAASNGFVLTTNGATSTWKSTSTLGFPSYWTFSSSTIWGLFSASSPLVYNNGTGAFSITQASSSADGYLSSTDWSTFNSKISLSSLSAAKPLNYNSGTGAFSTDFSTSSENVFTNTNTFSGSLLFTSASGTGLSATNLYGNIRPTGLSNTWVSVDVGGTIIATTSPLQTGGTVGKVAVWSNASTLTSGTILDNGTVSGVNATSSTRTFNIQGTAGTTSDAFTVASSSGTAVFTVGGGNNNVSYTGVPIPRTVGYTASSTITINGDSTDIATTTVNQTTTFANPTGSLKDHQALQVEIRATTTTTVSWGTAFASSTDLSNITSVASGTTILTFRYDKYVSKWFLLGKLGAFNF